MKVPHSIRQIYDDQFELNHRLQDTVDKRILSLKQPRWHYESRVKELQSFALKLETGRFTDPAKLEDFFACNLVVANTLEIDAAEQLIRSQFRLHNRRPGQTNWTHKSADSFQFDDLRLYMSLGDDPTLPPSDLADIMFEVQIKTFLQHAWSIATHDLIYKSDGANWSKERIAYQIKAMLEHAEVSIQEAERLAESTALKKEDQVTANIRKSIDLLKTQWGADTLPIDIRRLALNVTNLLDALEVRLNKLKKILEIEKKATGGALPVNLSPYATIVQSLLRHEKEKMNLLLTNKSGRIRVVIPSEIEFPEDINRTACCNGIFIGQPRP